MLSKHPSLRPLRPKHHHPTWRDGRSTEQHAAWQHHAFGDLSGAPDFDVELDDLIKALQEATERQYSGRGTQVGGTAGPLASSRRGLLYLQELHAIMKNILAGLPEPLANWESASHIQQPLRRTTSGTGEPTTPPTEPVSGTTD